MGWKNRKLEIGIAAAGALLFGLISFSSHQHLGSEPSGFFKNFQMGFEMPKFRSLRKLFSLEGREIQRYEQHEQVTSLDGQRPTNYVPPSNNNVGNSAKPNSVAKGNEAAKKTAPTKPTAQNPAKRGSLRANIVGGSDRFKSVFGRGNSGFETGARESAVSLPVQPNYSGGISAPDDTTVATKKDDKELSLDYWKSLIMAQPTAATAYKIIDALAKKKISEKDFYSLAEMLMQSSTAGYQKLGLYMVYNQANASAFSVVAKNFDKFQGELTTTAENYFMSYNQSARIGILSSVLGIANSKVQLIALTTVMSGLQKIRNGELPFPIDPRNRGTNVQAFQVTTYNQLLPQLEKLATNSESQISQSAIATISLLHSVASN